MHRDSCMSPATRVLQGHDAIDGPDGEALDAPPGTHAARPHAKTLTLYSVFDVCGFLQTLVANYTMRERGSRELKKPHSTSFLSHTRASRPR